MPQWQLLQIFECQCLARTSAADNGHVRGYPAFLELKHIVDNLFDFLPHDGFFRDVVYKGLLALSVVFLVSCSPIGVRRSVSIDGAPISYVLTGSGGPTVVFEASWHAGLDSWKPVFGNVAEFTTAVAYSRAVNSGDHFSSHRSADDVAHMLKALLEKAKVPKPYVLVGHSLGGMYVLRFAKLFPENVVGVILVDGVPKGFVRECQDAGLNCFPSESEIAAAPAHVAAEARGFEETEKQTPMPEELGNIPITVIAATEHGPKQGIWLRFQKEFAQELKNSRYVQADGSGHCIQRDRPELVIREIRLMVDKTKH